MSMQRPMIVPVQAFLPWGSPVPLPPRRPASRPLLAPPASVPAGVEIREDARMEEHWTAITGYVADLYLPNEG